MKKLLIVFLVLATLIVAGCQQGVEQQTPPTSTGDENTAATSTGSKTSTNSGTSSSGSGEEFDTSQELTTDQGCYDSDGGGFESIKGFIIDTEAQRFVDVCFNSYGVREYYCGITGYKMEKIINCDFGCENGVCVEGVRGENDCYDSDFTDKNVKGAVSYQGERFEDYCEDNVVLVENICTTTDIAGTKKIVCEAGCLEGGCVVPAPIEEDSTCNDPDAGPDSNYIKSTVTDTKGGFTDECVSGNYYVTEYYCNSYGYHDDKNIRCDFGCEDGACKRA
ncbi:hypothetical protein GOV05_03925 [Candidatus Woesearchaeota archaeon]|nr:hypothetical protein [Candidatus Woesearchaeota archaeon]